MRLYNPVYHFKRAIVDIRALRNGFATLGQPQTFTSVEQLSRVLHERMTLASTTVAVPSTITGIIVGALVQTSTGSIPAGLLINLLIANVLGVLGLEILWWYLSRDLYRARRLHGFAVARAVIGDLAVVHLHSLIGVLIINTVSMGLVGFVLENMHHWQPRWNLNRYVPAPLLSPLIGWCLLDAPFIRHMYDLYATHTEFLARKYQNIVCPACPLTETTEAIDPQKKTRVQTETPLKNARPDNIAAKEIPLRVHR